MWPLGRRQLSSCGYRPLQTTSPRTLVCLALLSAFLVTKRAQIHLFLSDSGSLPGSLVTNTFNFFIQLGGAGTNCQLRHDNDNHDNNHSVIVFLVDDPDGTGCHDSGGQLECRAGGGNRTHQTLRVRANTMKGSGLNHNSNGSVVRLVITTPGGEC